MKKTFLLLIAIVCFVGSYAQSVQSEFELLQSIYGMDKKEITNNFLELHPDQDAAFWELYEAYEAERIELGKKKFDLLSKYVTDYGEIAPEDADAILKESIPLRKKSDKLIDSYYKKVKKKTDPVVALQFYQLERYLSDLIRLRLLEELFSTKD